MRSIVSLFGRFMVITIPYFLCRSAKPIAAWLVAAKAQIVCEKIFFTRPPSFGQTRVPNRSQSTASSMCTVTSSPKYGFFSAVKNTLPSMSGASIALRPNQHSA